MTLDLLLELGLRKKARRSHASFEGDFKFIPYSPLGLTMYWTWLVVPVRNIQGAHTMSHKFHHCTRVLYYHSRCERVVIRSQRLGCAHLEEGAKRDCSSVPNISIEISWCLCYLGV